MGALYTSQERAQIEANRLALVDLISGKSQPRRQGSARTLGLELERIVIDEARATSVSYADKPGIRDLLEAWTDVFKPNERIYIDHRLFGFQGHVDTLFGDIGISITLEPGSQLEASVGPSSSVCALVAALNAFDELFATTCAHLGVTWRLVALGVNPYVVDPQEVPLIPKARYKLMDAFLPTMGVYARDMMRISASTQVSIDCGDPEELARTYQLAVALGPLFSFLLDNVSSWRGLTPKDTPRMVRSRIWEHVDPTRTGTVPKTFSSHFSAQTYGSWLLGVEPILFTSKNARTISTGNATTADVMAMRKLSKSELLHLLSMVFPNTRLKGFLEIRDADSLPPRLAGAYAAMIKGLFYNKDSFEGAFELLAKGRSDEDIAHAHHALRRDGWKAKLFALPLTDLVERLVELANAGLDDSSEQRLFCALSDLWTNQKVPRDLLEKD